MFVFQLMFGLMGCGSLAVNQYESCGLELTSDISEASPGTTLTVAGGPLTTSWDTVVNVGGIAASDVTIDRSDDCTTCDTCRLENNCEPCGICPPCTGSQYDPDDVGVCGACEQSTSFTVPQVPPGQALVTVVNANGSGTFDLVVLGGQATDTSKAETGLVTAQTGDTQQPSTGHTGLASTGQTGVAATGHTGAATADTSSQTGETGNGGTGASADTASADTGGQTTSTGPTGSDTGAASDTSGDTGSAHTSLSETGTSDTGTGDSDTASPSTTGDTSGIAQSTTGDTAP